MVVPEIQEDKLRQLRSRAEDINRCNLISGEGQIAQTCRVDWAQLLNPVFIQDNLIDFGSDPILQPRNLNQQIHAKVDVHEAFHVDLRQTCQLVSTQVYLLNA